MEKANLLQGIRSYQAISVAAGSAASTGRDLSRRSGGEEAFSAILRKIFEEKKMKRPSSAPLLPINRAA